MGCGVFGAFGMVRQLLEAWFVCCWSVLGGWWWALSASGVLFVEPGGFFCEGSGADVAVNLERA